MDGGVRYVRNPELVGPDDPNPTVGGCGGKRQREDSDAFLDTSVTLSQAQDRPGSKRCEDLCPPDAGRRARAILIEAFRDAHRWLDALVAPRVPSLWKSEGDGGA
jgi:hypothetical protein